MQVMQNEHGCGGYPICPMCGRPMLFATPVVRSQDHVVHLACRDASRQAS